MSNSEKKNKMGSRWGQTRKISGHGERMKERKTMSHEKNVYVKKCKTLNTPPEGSMKSRGTFQESIEEK